MPSTIDKIVAERTHARRMAIVDKLSIRQGRRGRHPSRTASPSRAQPGTPPFDIHPAGLESSAVNAGEGEVFIETQNAVAPGTIEANLLEDHSFPTSEKARGKLREGSLTIRIPARATPRSDAATSAPSLPFVSDGHSYPDANEVADGQPARPKPSTALVSNAVVTVETVDIGPAPIPSAYALPLPAFDATPLTTTLPQRSDTYKLPVKSAITPYPHAGRPSSTARVLERMSKTSRRAKHVSLLDKFRKHNEAGTSSEPSPPSETAGTPARITGAPFEGGVPSAHIEAQDAGAPVEGAAGIVQSAGQATEDPGASVEDAVFLA
ncbi:hypothetical protein HGRIS_000865 [Hohenbuehelia grisea]|uniref:Uncharacterized protein n=1 Tax=Hohenbuehelia grisea TaxID=104357 RepID=A0ABR3IPZ8_9AGAR